MSRLTLAGVAAGIGAGVALAAGVGAGTAVAAAPHTVSVSHATTAATGGGLSEPAPVSRAAKAAKGATGPSTLSPKEAALMKRQAPLLEAANVATTASRAKGSDIAGVSIDVAKGRVDLYRTSPAKALPTGMARAGVKVSVHKARFSAGQLEQAAARLEASGKALGAKGVTVSAISVPVDGSGLRVTVLSPATPKAGAPEALSATSAKSVLAQSLGGAVSSVTTSKATWSPSSEYYSGWRFNDYAPWYGGDRIAQGCTTGFPALYNGTMEVMTATHCGGSGTVFTNGPRASGPNVTMGAVTYANAGTDISVIDVAGSTNYINVGPAQNSSVRAVGSWQSPVVGSYICQSGSYTGEVCGLRVVDTNQSVCTSYILWWCTAYMGPMADVVNSAGSGSYAAGHGDSGGPLYWYDSSGYVRPVGQVHGQLFPNAQAAYPAYYSDQMWCPAPEGWQQRCSSGFSFAHMPGK